MAFRKDTIEVTDVSFAPVGSEITWTVSFIDGVTEISTILTEKNADTGEISICYDALLLPDAIESLTECNLSNPVITDNCGLVGLIRLPLVISAGTAPSDVSGGAAEVRLGDNIHFWSDTLGITVDKGSAIIRIENSSPYAEQVSPNANNDADFNPNLVLPLL